MLGKLFKYEVKNTAKIMLIIYFMLAAVTAYGMIVFSSSSLNSNHPGTIALIFASSAILLYIFTVITLFIVTFVFLCVHFYRSMYSDQGYLTHTLPVSPVATLNVKIIMSLLWLFFAIILTILSTLGMIAAANGGGKIKVYSMEELNEIFMTSFGLSFLPMILLFLALILVCCLSYLMLIFVSASIGQLSTQKKEASAIITGIVLYFIQQIAATILVFILAFIMLSKYDVSIFDSNITLDSIGGPLQIMLTAFGSTIGVMLFFITIYYIVCNVIVRKHINLD